MTVSNDSAVTTGSSPKKGYTPNTTQTDLLLDIDFSSNSDSTSITTQNQSQIMPDQQTTSSGSRTMFDSLGVRTQPVATTAATAVITTVSTQSPASAGGVFGDLVDLFGSNNNTTSGSVSQTPQTAPQHVCALVNQIQ